MCRRTIKYLISVAVGFLIVAGILTSCYHGDPTWPNDPTRPPPPFVIDPCQDPSYIGPCPPPSFLKKMDGGVAR